MSMFNLRINAKFTSKSPRIFIAVLMCSHLGSGCDNHDVGTAPEIKDITESVYASGVLKSIDQYRVFSKYGGKIEKIYIREGMHVKKGDTIFRFDNKGLQIATENAKLISSTADYNLNMDKLKEASNNIELARKKRVNDSLLFYRQKELWKESIGTKIELEQKEFAFEQAITNYQNALVHYQDLERQLKLSSVQSKNNLRIAKLQEADFVIRSALDGIVYQINKEVGEFTNNTDVLAVIGSAEFIIELNIDELDIIKVKPGQEVIMRMESYPNEIYKGKIKCLDQMMNLRTRSFLAEATFNAPPIELFPNLTVEANIIIRTKENALTIPRAYLINDNTVVDVAGRRIKVEVGLMDYQLVEIINGIDSTTRLIIPSQ